MKHLHNITQRYHTTLGNIVLILTLIIPISAPSAADFDIYQSGFSPMQIAWQCVTNRDDSRTATATTIDHIVRHDLTSSQSFRALEPISFLATTQDAFRHIDYADWRIIGADIVAICRPHKRGSQSVWQLQIHDPFRNKQLAAIEFTDMPTATRHLSHQIANYIYHTVIGVPGHFDSHILFVHKHGDRSDLIYMDQDGANRQVIGRNFTLLLSPDWSPDNRLVALNTYVGNRPRLETFRLHDGKRTAFGHFKGLNSTPEFSPDGRWIAATLSKSGNPDIYLYSIKTKKWHQLTHSTAIDTTPSWSPDSQWIAFASNRAGGNPQIYRKNIKTGRVLRVSTQGSYNSSPAWSPRGDRIAIISHKNWAFALATINPDGSDIRYLVTGARVESPAWSKNGQMLTYSAENDGVRRIYRIPAWGGRPEAITAANRDASDAVWSR
ncbi:MAG: DPP IV N-terminal domain-containing protein [Mariprofundales bacterium]|nr:DPP IV N-terminal domain-containing protein [Mariprofundales bacterium]